MSAAAEVMELTRFGEELEELRRRRGLSFRALGARAGVSEGHLCNLVHGRRGYRATDALMERVAAALGVEPDAFQEYRQRRALELYPDEVDELYRRRRG